MSPQCEDGYTKIANELLEALCSIRIPGESMQIFLVILRKTYGYGKKSDRIAQSQFVESTGIIKNHVRRAVAKLEDMNIIYTNKGNFSGLTYEINKDYDTWKSTPKKVTTQKVTNNGPEVTNIGVGVTIIGAKVHPKRCPQKKKETYQKKITKEIGMLEICVAWKAFVEMRKIIKKPMTPYAMKLRVNDLFKLMSEGFDPIAVLNQSTASNYQDLYPLKENSNERSGVTGRTSQAGRKTGFTEANGAGTDFMS